MAMKSVESCYRCFGKGQTMIFGGTKHRVCQFCFGSGWVAICTRCLGRGFQTRADGVSAECERCKGRCYLPCFRVEKRTPGQQYRTGFGNRHLVDILVAKVASHGVE